MAVENALAPCLAVDPVEIRDLDGLLVVVTDLTSLKPLSACGCKSSQVGYEVCEQYGPKGAHFCEDRAAGLVNSPRPLRSPQRLQLGIASGGGVARPFLRLRCGDPVSEPVRTSVASQPTRTLSVDEEIEARRNATRIDTAQWVDTDAAVEAERWGLSRLRVKLTRVARCVDIRFRGVVASDNLTIVDTEMSAGPGTCPCQGDWIKYSVFERSASGIGAQGEVMQMTRISEGAGVLPDRDGKADHMRFVLAADNRSHFEEPFIEVTCF